MAKKAQNGIEAFKRANNTLLGKRIRELREKKNLLQRDLAEAIGGEISTISKIENGKRPLDVVELMQIAEVLECSLPRLLLDVQMANISKDPEQMKVVKAFLEALDKANEKS